MKASGKTRTRRILWRVVSWAIGTLALLFAVLVIHIYQVTKNKAKNSSQLSRIDFTLKPDSTEAGKVQNFVAALPGVQNTLFNIRDGILVYTYDSEKQSADKVYTQLMRSGKYQAKKYTVSPAELKQGCPAGYSNNSFSGRFVHGIQSLFQ